MQEAAQLSQPQRARLLSLRATLLQDIDRITCERRSIMGGIKASPPPLTGGALSKTSTYCSTCHAHAQCPQAMALKEGMLLMMW